MDNTFQNQVALITGAGAGKKLKNNGQIYENFLNNSLKKFIEYQR